MEKINNFTAIFNQNKNTLGHARTGADAAWYSVIQNFLANLPIIGKLFAPQGSKLVSEIEELTLAPC